MDLQSKAFDVQKALVRAKQKMSSLQNELSERERATGSREVLLEHMQKGELKDSLCDMYKANPKVNVELKQRLPSPVRHYGSETTPDLGCLSAKGSPSTPSGQARSETALQDPSPDTQLPQLATPRPEAGGPRFHTEPGEGDPTGTPEGEGTRWPVSRTNGHSVSVSEVQQDSAEEESGAAMRTCDLPPAGHHNPGGISSVQEDQGNTKASSDFNSARQVPALDKERNIAFLLKEVDFLRDLTKQLQDKLAMKDLELETKLVDLQLMETKLEAQACKKAAALVQEIYTAQKERDQAMMARIRLANEERDEALLRAKKLQQAATELENINPEEYDMDLEELLKRVSSTESAQDITRTGAVIVDMLQKARERRRKITAEEMNAVIEERDAALSRCKRLEQDVHQLREQIRAWANNSRHLTVENNQQRALKDLVQTERQRAVEHGWKQEEEIRTLRTYSVYQSLPRESGFMELFDTTRGSTPQGLHTREGVVSQDSVQAAQLRRPLAHSIQAQLERDQESQSEAEEKVQK